MLSDWVEFSPYEIGMAKYGTFMAPDLFGSKFFMGTVVKKYEENPLHFLMGKWSKSTISLFDCFKSWYILNYSVFALFLGVWGSAFSILFNRVLGVSGSQNKGSTMEEELGIVKTCLQCNN